MLIQEYALSTLYQVFDLNQINVWYIKEQKVRQQYNAVRTVFL